MSKAGMRASAAILIVMTSQAAYAQPSGAAEAGGGDEIIVTARKREETALETPVVLTAIGAGELERRAINSLDSIARVVPQLLIGEGGGTIQGGIIALRGITSPDSNPFADQSVSFNVDGVQVARASVRRLATMDLAQVEVLKGPQALFFGKNSPGGIISMRTADPTANFEGKLSAGHELEASEWRAEGFVSAPLSDTLGLRVAGYYSKVRGWVKNKVPEGEALRSARDWGPHGREWAGRATLKWEPSDVFNLRIKLSHNKFNGDDAAGNVQFVDCPAGSPQGGAIDDCRPNDTISTGELGPNFGLVQPIFGDGSTRSKSTQTLGSIEANYDLSDDLRLTSVTGLYTNKFWNRSNFTTSYLLAGPPPVLASVNRYKVRDFSQELRLASDFESIVNFVLGGHYSESKASTGSTTYRNAATPLYNNNYFLRQKGEAWSIFGQMSLDITPQLELSAGGRYSHEKKELTDVRQGTALDPTPIPIPTISTKATWKNFSPEVTLAYRPTENVNIFGSYKRGFLSGGFNSGSGSLREDLKFNQEKIKGFEGGVKASLLGGALRTNLAAYHYKLTGYQVQLGVQSPVNNIVFTTIRNAASVTTKGAEFDVSYRPATGLTLRGAVAYNSAKYGDYDSPCYVGQTPALGCTLDVNPLTGAARNQTLAGQQMYRAPKWGGSLGFSYETPVASGLKLALSGDMSFTSRFYTSSDNHPGGVQDSYQLFDATVALSDEADRWEAAVIGRNLTNQYYYLRTNNVPFTGGATGTAGAFRGDLAGPVSRGREVMLRVTYRFGN